MIKRRYSAEQNDFAFNWADRWFQLVDLILNLVRTDESPSPPPPNEIDEINYQGLRFWFKDHESRFIQLWGDFYATQEWALNPWDKELDDMPGAEKYLENPFFFCYHPENLYKLIQELDIQSGVNLWEPSKNRALTAAKELVQMDRRVKEFFFWICENTYDSSAVNEQ